MHLFRIVDASGVDEAWYEDAAAADAGVAQRLGLTVEQVEPLRRRITIDPVVVRRDGARWRSRQAWSVRSGDVAIRIFEMLQIDETIYDH
jgi:hypothetical protein